MRGVIYARYSEGPRQTDQSIEGQVADCRAFAADHGIDVVDVYADRHISGKSIDGRDAFQQMIRDAERRLFDCVIVWKIDRFGRSREDIAVNKIKLRRAGVQLMYAREAVPDGPEGILMESLLEGLAEYYSADLRQKVIRGQRESAKKGRLPVGHLPIGYVRNEEQLPVVDENGAEGVREVFRLAAEGQPIQLQQEALARRGFLTKRGTLIGQATIYRMLRNEHYIGAPWIVQGVEVPCPAIITKEQFDAAARFQRSRKLNASGRAGVDYLLSGKCYCEKCGKMLQGRSATSKTGRRYYYYECPEKGHLRAQRDELEDLVIRKTFEDVLTDEMIGKLTKRIMEIQEERQMDDPAAALVAQIAALQVRADNLVAAIEAGGGARLVARLEEIEKQIADLRGQGAEVRTAKPIVPEPIVRGWLQSLQAADLRDPAARKQMIRTFVEGVLVGPEDVTIAYNTTEKGLRGVRVDPEKWTQRSRTRTLEVRDGYIILHAKRAPAGDGIRRGPTN